MRSLWKILGLFPRYIILSRIFCPRYSRITTAHDSNLVLHGVMANERLYASKLYLLYIHRIYFCSTSLFFQTILWIFIKQFLSNIKQWKPSDTANWKVINVTCWKWNILYWSIYLSKTKLTARKAWRENNATARDASAAPFIC